MTSAHQASHWSTLLIGCVTFCPRVYKWRSFLKIWKGDEKYTTIFYIINQLEIGRYITESIMNNFQKLEFVAQKQKTVGFKNSLLIDMVAAFGS